MSIIPAPITRPQAPPALSVPIPQHVQGSRINSTRNGGEGAQRERKRQAGSWVVGERAEQLGGEGEMGRGGRRKAKDIT